MLRGREGGAAGFPSAGGPAVANNVQETAVNFFILCTCPGATSLWAGDKENRFPKDLGMRDDLQELTKKEAAVAFPQLLLFLTIRFLPASY